MVKVPVTVSVGVILVFVEVGVSLAAGVSLGRSGVSV
jgi:hypothetical protein